MCNTAHVYTRILACTAAPVHATARVYTTTSACNAALAGVHHNACVHGTSKRSMYVRICCGVQRSARWCTPQCMRARD
eukprot:6355650-Pyramimonas_sp.AAC.1